MTTLLLVRHGETVWHAENRYAGVTDVALTPAGRAQAERLAAWAAARGIDAVWSSPLSRARDTAAPAAAALALPVAVDGDLIEIDFGAAEGRTLSELPPGQVAAFQADPIAGAFPGAEDPVKAAHRGAAALRRIAARHPGARVLVVAHNTLLRLTLCDLLGIPLPRYRRTLPKIDNATFTELRLVTETPEPALITYNAPLPQVGSR